MFPRERRTYPSAKKFLHARGCMKSKYGTWMRLTFALSTVAVTGCATAPTKTVAVQDVSSLAGLPC
jgi:hypothetical protein